MFKRQNYTKLSSNFFLGGEDSTMVQTQGLVLVRQSLYYLSQASQSFVLQFFSDRVSFFA
jgi:hypothetical protein